MSDQKDTVWMTAATLASLEAELEELGRRADADADRLREIELRDLIRRAEVGAKPDDGLVEPGMTVTVRFTRDGSEETFLLGSRELVKQGGQVDLDVYSPSSPLGAAITGRSVGETVSFAAPNGSTLEVAVVSAVPFG
ncbi:GreA/GreB family elongation factor [Microbacterium sp. zg.Y1090]|uniref:GreA/GreB family elongation factor n=1 Tax=Microbacterium TaxID=33882 RepID=UPI00214BED52|nr:MULTISPECIES: GreA/GreB family elongation factor [unclassified Microbacterium]MCR2813792.1 GreA/GreB family elongation factor [Microbacterium sp. zg.Y1084]MCR2819694.1 GreA/GreB family elongation factor [Microbacterium sp. zg.Y1090]MDL5487542.1 GreA/GreB family elongation factor [Microbacterium sp. zg-Y1211]WIM28062.1 GreA/GreB family elongation factor [Microbacterium sp. zg-Y1090]